LFHVFRSFVTETVARVDSSLKENWKLLFLGYFLYYLGFEKLGSDLFGTITFPAIECCLWNRDLFRCSCRAVRRLRRQYSFPFKF